MAKRLIPSWIDKVNYIVTFFQNPCNAPWTVYFETALPAAGKALLVILAFGMDDVIRGWARPGGRRSPYHRRKGKKVRFRFRGIPELGEAIGSKLPHAKQASSRKVTQGVRNMWVIDGVLQRLLFWWLIVDVVTDTIYEWSTTISKTEFCKGPFGSNLLAEGTGGSALALVGWTAMLLPTIRYETGSADWNITSGSVGPGLFAVGLALKFENTWFDQVEILIGIFKSPIFTSAYDVSDEQFIPGFGKGEAVAQATIKGPATFNIGWKTTSGVALGIEGFISVMQIGN